MNVKFEDAGRQIQTIQKMAVKNLEVVKLVGLWRNSFWNMLRLAPTFLPKNTYQQANGAMNAVFVELSVSQKLCTTDQVQVKTNCKQVAGPILPVSFVVWMMEQLESL